MNRELLQRYFDNVCTPAERETVARWLSDPLRQEEVLQYMEEEWGQAHFSDAQLKSAAKELNLPFETLLKPVPSSTAPIWPLWKKIATGVAASVIFLAAGIYIGYHYQGRMAATDKEEVYYADAQPFKGKRSRLMLNDGSEIYLNANSRITIPNDTNARQVVYLEGEAYFKVANRERPLIIKTKDFVASSKGSQFNISAFPKDSTVTVTVQKGRAEVTSNTEQYPPLLSLRIVHGDSTGKKDSAAGRPTTMPMMSLRAVVVRANECVTFDKRRTAAVAPAHLSEEEAAAWKDGIVYIRQVDSAELVNELNRWFDVEVSLNTGGIPLKAHNCGFKNPTLEDVLRHIAAEQGLEYRIEGRHVFLNRPAAKN